MNLSRYIRLCFSPVFILMCTACDPCENQVLQEELSPTKTQKAVVFQRQCGALGGTSTQVSVLPTDAKPFAGGNVFGADTNADPSLETSSGGPTSGGPAVTVKWLGEQELQITHDARVRVFQSEEALGGVTITYDAQAQPEPAPEPAAEPKPTDESPKRKRK
ncbi:MAG: hypothetical protein HOP18_27550 [Deltaproteobacteria bacterium]|nr:hypothetical protein [Deltaproteobacteria bacterium]